MVGDAAGTWTFESDADGHSHPETEIVACASFSISWKDSYCAKLDLPISTVWWATDSFVSYGGDCQKTCSFAQKKKPTNSDQNSAIVLCALKSSFW
mmetsp:Transcript_99019/g.285738  ORF Transcript_99019/g.285738 Transcript_99019/m.285738 type:complete len:96 (+) Transcript_99019:137-424(+)